MSTVVEESLAFCGSHIEAALNEGFVCQKEMKNSGKGNVQPSRWCSMELARSSGAARERKAET